MKIEIYSSDEKEKRLEKEGAFEMNYVDTDLNEEYGHLGDVEANLINIHDDVINQTVLGVGGAFTESDATTWHNIPIDI